MRLSINQGLRIILFLYPLTLMLIGCTQSSKMPGSPDIQVRNTWIPVPLLTTKSSPVYMTLKNYGSQKDQLLAVHSPMAESARLYTTVRNEKRLAIRPVERIPIPAQGSTVLGYEGVHIMLIGLKETLKEGQLVPVTLTFQHAGDLKLMVSVRDLQMKGYIHQRGFGGNGIRNYPHVGHHIGHNRMHVGHHIGH